MKFIPAFNKFLFTDNKKYMISYIVCMSFMTVSNIINSSLISKFMNTKDVKLIPKMLVSMLFGLVSYEIINRIDSYFIPKVESFCQLYIIDNILDRYMFDYEENNSGEFLSKIVKFPYICRELFFQIRSGILPIIVNVVLTFGRLVMIDIRIAVSYLVTMGCVGIVIYKRYKKDMNEVTRMSNYNGLFHEDVSDLLDNLIDVYSFRTREKEVSQIINTQKTVSSQYTRSFKSSFKTLLLCNIILYILTSLIVIFDYKKNRVITDSIMLCGFSAYKISAKLSNYPEIIYNMGISKEIIESMNKIQSQDNSTFKPAFDNYRISMVDVSVKYGDKTIINKFNLDILQNDCVIIEGKIGCGKSSILKSILRLKHYTGNIYIDGHDIQDINIDYYRSNLFYVKQNPLPFNRSIYDILLYGTNKSIKDVDRLLTELDLCSVFGNGRKLDSMVGKKGSKLSGGQRMILYILKIFLNDKKIILLDEPSSSLDNETTNIILNILKKMVGKKTLIIVSHDERIKSISNNRILLG